MSSVLLVIGSAFLAIAAFIHVVIFYLESIAWGRPSTWRRFGVASQQDAETLRPMAYNQGYYNGFLAVGVVFGLILLSSASLHQAGLALAGFSALSMVLAATVLITSNSRLARAAVFQGAAPLVGIVFLALSILV
jgi:putative membrane protein